MAEMKPAKKHCRHYHYTLDFSQPDSGPTCAVGRDISWPGASKVCWPEPTGSCPKRSDYTAAELAAQDADFKAMIERQFKGAQAIPAEGHQGEVECPSCGTRLSWTRAENGHVWAACETGCTSWIQ